QPIGLQLVQHKMERRLHACRDGCARLIAALIADAERRQSKTRRRYARYRSSVVSCGECAVIHLSGRGVGLLPEKKKRRFLDLFEELLFLAGLAAKSRPWL